MNLTFTLRSLRRSPGFAMLSVCILALGIGANTAIFSVVHGVVLRPLSYDHPEQLVSVSMAWPGGFHYGQVSGPDFLDFRADGKATFQSIAAYANELVSVVANQKPEFTGAAVVSEDFLRTMRVKPLAGRAFVASDFNGHPGVAIVSEGFWRRHFGGISFSAGHLLKAAGKQVEIVGLLPAGFHFPEASNTEVWMPFFERLQDANRGGHNYHVVGRLQPSSNVEQAQARLAIIASRLEKAYPGTNKQAGVYITSLSNFTVRGVKTSLYLLWLAVALVLMIACANIANLLLVRGSGQIRELAIRTAMGASRARIVRQLFAETLLLASGGALGGVALAYVSLPLLLRWTPTFVPRLNDVQIDWTVLSFCGAMGLLSSLLFGLAPAIHASHVDPNRDLRAGGSRGVVGGTAPRLRRIFITAEVALCMVLLVSAGLLLQSFTALTSVDLGFNPTNLLVAHISVPEGEKSAAANRVFSPLLERASANPAVASAAISRGLPDDPDTRSTVDYIIPGQTLSDMNTTAPLAGISVVSGSYFETVGIPLVAGRAFSARDNAEAPLTVIVNRALVKRSFPKQNPVGLKVLCGYDLITMKWMTIVGIVADARLDGPKAPPMPELYLPYLQHPTADMNVLVKTRTDPVALAHPIRTLTQSLDPEATVKLTTMESHLASAVATPRFSSALISAFAGLAVLLSAIGIYGVIAYSVTQRTGEIGLRMALGANQGKVLTMILLEALRLVGGGLAIGLAGSIVAARLLRSQLFEVSPSDPAVYGLVLCTLLSVALLAAFLPAWRASHVEPLEALRQE
jgi:putative ABC transport system permease protein